ncbi:MAG: hypothetical protein L3J84_00770 [Gammaproteobacteria bacterium]|nr:hypothetical protein [Gammaproteobacteria bacterium]
MHTKTKILATRQFTQRLLQHASVTGKTHRKVQWLLPLNGLQKNVT